MVVSLLGSGFAGLLSYNKADDRVRKLRTLERLLELAKAARTAESIQALDELQTEIDAVQAAMIREIETGALDEADDDGLYDVGRSRLAGHFRPADHPRRPAVHGPSRRLRPCNPIAILRRNSTLFGATAGH